MTRPLRLQYENACYHIMSRAPRQELLFKNSNDKEHFVNLLEYVCLKYGIVCYAYCLLDNHYHMFIQTRQPNLSKAMHSLHCSYGTWFRNKYKLPGAIFQGRYKSILVDSDSYAVQLGTYIHLNAFRCGLEKKIGEYPWNSLGYYVKRKKSPPLLDITLVLDQFGNKLNTAKKNYLKHIIENLNMEDPLLNPRYGIAVGSESFLEEIEEKIKSLKFDTEIPVMKSVGTISPEVIIRLLADNFGISMESIVSHKRNNDYKKIALYIINLLCDTTLREIATLFDMNYSSVSHSIRRFEKECSDDITLLKKRNKVLKYVMTNAKTPETYKRV